LIDDAACAERGRESALSSNKLTMGIQAKYNIFLDMTSALTL
jgi:hypothetical protein